MINGNSCIPLPSNDSREEFIITSHRVILEISKELGHFVINKMTETHGEDWANEIKFPSFEHGKIRVYKLEDIFDISALGNELCRNSSTPFRDCFKFYGNYEIKKILDLIDLILKQRNAVFHNAIVQSAVLIKLSESVNSLCKLLKINLCFDPILIVERVNDLIIGIKFEEISGSTPTSEEKLILEKNFAAAKNLNDKLTEDIATKTSTIDSLKKQLEDIVKSGKSLESDILKEKYEALVFERNDAINTQNEFLGKYTVLEEFMETYFEIKDVNDILLAFSQINDSTHNREIGNVYVIPALLKKIRITIPLNYKEIIVKDNTHEISYLTISEKDLYMLFRSLRPEGGVFFIDNEYEVFFPAKDEGRAILPNTYIYAGNLSKCCIFV